MKYEDEDENEPISRARYLMSPYNLREANRIKSNKSYLIAFALIFGLFILLGISIKIFH